MNEAASLPTTFHPPGWGTACRLPERIEERPRRL